MGAGVLAGQASVGFWLLSCTFVFQSTAVPGLTFFTPPTSQSPDRWLPLSSTLHNLKIDNLLLIQKDKMTFTTLTKTFTSVTLATLLIIGCTTTTTKTKNPTFSKSTDSLQVDLNKLVSCEGINLDGKEITNNGKITTELEIDITNGQNIPADENQMNALGKQIASEIKEALQDKAVYQTYKVLFITKTESAGVTSRTWKGKIFKSEEL
jgi:hypothetical protein